MLDSSFAYVHASSSEPVTYEHPAFQCPEIEKERRSLKLIQLPNTSAVPPRLTPNRRLSGIGVYALTLDTDLTTYTLPAG